MKTRFFVEPAPLTVEYAGRVFNDIISADRERDPITESILYGDKLQDGYLILSRPTGRLPEAVFKYSPRDAVIRNRWCRVTQLRKDEDFVQDKQGIGHFVTRWRFIAVYEDGMEDVRDSDHTYCWIVKNDSMDWDLNRKLTWD